MQYSNHLFGSIWKQCFSTNLSTRKLVETTVFLITSRWFCSWRWFSLFLWSYFRWMQWLKFFINCKALIIIKYWLYLVFLMVPVFLLCLCQIFLVLQYTLQLYNGLQQVRRRRRTGYKTLQIAIWGLVWKLFKRSSWLKEVISFYNVLQQTNIG